MSMKLNKIFIFISSLIFFSLLYAATQDKLIPVFENIKQAQN